LPLRFCEIKLLDTGVVGNFGNARVLESVLKILICPDIIKVVLDFLVAFING